MAQGPRRIDVEERRARLVRRHHLLAPATDLVRVAGDLCGLHSTDAGTVMLSAWARVGGFAVADAEAALYDDRSLARILAMRRTMFVVPTEDAPLLHAATTRDMVDAQRRRAVKLLADSGTTGDEDPATWLARVEDATMVSLHARGAATAAELKQDVPELAGKVVYAPEKAYGGEFGVSTRVLFLLATDGRIVRGRPRGSWLSTQYRWAPTDTWFDGRVDVDALDTDTARATLVRRWLATFGPATFDDVVWWTGWTKTATRRALTAVAPTEVDLDGETGLVLADDDAPEPPAGHTVALLPALDPTTMGWRDRDWYLDPALRPELFDRNGNAGPTVWVDGQVVGGWAQADDGTVVRRLLVDVGADAAAEVEDRAGRLQAWLDGVRVLPRFRTPLEKRLAASST